MRATDHRGGVAMAAAVIVFTAIPGGAAGDGAEGGTRLSGSAQETEAVMVAAGRWVIERLPPGKVCLDPHRSGQGTDEAVIERVGRALSAELRTLEETRECTDVMDPASCSLNADALMAIARPRIDGRSASVRVYTWHASGSIREPVAKRTWDLELRRESGGWTVVSGS